MKTGILTFEQFLGKKDVGSSRIRGHWIAQHWKEAGADLGECEIFRYGVRYDAVIFQKAYFVEYAKDFKGIKILDLCDPDWLHWSYKVVEMLQEVDAVTVSSMELMKAVSKFTDKPVYFVPDRADLSVMLPPKEHVGPTKIVAWFGYAHNFPILDSAVKALYDKKLELVVISDNTYTPPAAFKVTVRNYPFSVATYMKDLQEADIVINPKYDKGKWKYKSENKTVIAKALGLPVAHNGDELNALMTEEARQKASKEGLEWVKNEMDILQSVVDYKDVILDIQKTKEVA